MIDLHSHVLPGIDDGPATARESLEMGRIYKQAGYSRVVATPHWILGTGWTPTPSEIANQVDTLNQRLKQDKISLEVLPGMEVALDPELPAALDEGKLQPLGETSCLLLETPYQMLPLGWQRIFFAIKSRGYAVLLAHPERCAQLAENPYMIDAFLELDIYMQVNWDSFLGYQGRDSAKLARYMAAKGFIHCLATDSHDPHNRSPDSVKRAAVELERLIGSENLRILAKENPSRVLKNEALVPMRQKAIHETSGKIRPWLSWLKKH